MTICRQLFPVSFKKDSLIQFNGKSYLTFSSNDYLNLSCCSHLKTIASQALEIYGMGSGGARLLGGDHVLFHELEAYLVSLFEYQACLIFNSGYQANVGLISSLLGKKDIVFADKFVHASQLDGVRLSGAFLCRYRHLDLIHLEILLKKYRHKYRRALVLTEGLFSMEGDQSDLAGLVDLKKKYDCSLMVDDAHSFGVLGQKGLGLAYAFRKDIDFLLATFGKALGSAGAFVLCRSDDRQFFINHCRSFIYSTALPLPVIAWNRAALDWVLEHQDERLKYLERVSLFRRELSSFYPHEIKGLFQIISLFNSHEDRLNLMCCFLKEKGYWTNPIYSPTVPVGQARLRLSLTVSHDQTVLDDFLSVLSDVVKKI